jgi:hypothetical protein
MSHLIGPRTLALLFLFAAACGPARTPSAPTSGGSGMPPSGWYSARPITLSDTCAPARATTVAERRFFVSTTASGAHVRANVPLTFDGLPWEELASRATIDFEQSLTLVEAPAPRCPAARRRREIRIAAARPTGFDLEVEETWSVPDDPDCELPEEAPRVSCARVNRFALHVEQECASQRNVVLNQCAPRRD